MLLLWAVVTVVTATLDPLGDLLTRCASEHASLLAETDAAEVSYALLRGAACVLHLAAFALHEP
jgi:hypothetical protein